MSFGVYPEVSLKRAREKRDESRRVLAEGLDPSKPLLGTDLRERLFRT